MMTSNWGPGSREERHVNVNVNDVLAMSEQEFDNSGESGPHMLAKGGKPPANPPQITHDYIYSCKSPSQKVHTTHRASCCAKRGGHVQLCSTPRGARRIEPEAFTRMGQLLPRRPSTGPEMYCAPWQCMCVCTDSALKNMQDLGYSMWRHRCSCKHTCSCRAAA